MGIASNQMPASPVEIRLGVSAHNFLLPLLLRQPLSHFKNNRRNLIAMRLFGGSYSGRRSACQTG
jgi:hypothetical protein